MLTSDPAVMFVHCDVVGGPSYINHYKSTMSSSYKCYITLGICYIIHTLAFRIKFRVKKKGLIFVSPQAMLYICSDKVNYYDKVNENHFFKPLSLFLYTKVRLSESICNSQFLDNLSNVFWRAS